MLFFEVAQFDGILKKISEFSNSLLSEVVKSYRGSKVIRFLLKCNSMYLLVFMSEW